MTILADGSVLALGKVALKSSTLAEDFSLPHDGVLSVNLTSPYRRCSVHVMRRQSLWENGSRLEHPPILSVWLKDPFPDLLNLDGLQALNLALHAAEQGPSLADVHQRFPARQFQPFPSIFGHVRTINGKVSVNEDGVLLQFSGPICPIGARQDVPAVIGARVECDVLIPAKYISAVVTGTLPSTT